jgi:hypothetical protein
MKIHMSFVISMLRDIDLVGTKDARWLDEVGNITKEGQRKEKYDNIRSKSETKQRP